MILYVIVWACFVWTTAAHEPRFYRAGSSNETVKVYNPSLSQVFYETLHRYQDVTFTLAEPLMYNNQDATFYFELLLPDPHSRALCSGVRVVVSAPNHNDVIFELDGLGNDETKVFEPFLQEPLVRIGDAVRYTGTFDTADGFRVRAKGPSEHEHCNVALVFGTRERMSFGTLIGYPYISFATWGWIYGYIGLFWVFAIPLPIVMALLIVLCAPSAGGKPGGVYLFKVLGFSFFFAVWLTRIYAFARAGAYGAIPGTSDVLWAILIVTLDTFFVIIVGVNTFAERFRESASMCIGCVFCFRWLRCFTSCMSDAEEVRGLYIFYVLCLLLSFFAFSPGFYFGPFFVLLALLLSSREGPACACCNWVQTEPTISYQVWA